MARNVVLFRAEALWDVERDADEAAGSLLHGGVDNDLECRAGAIIEVLADDTDGDADWYVGRVGEQVGFFPLNYVKRLDCGVAEQSAAATSDANASDGDYAGDNGTGAFPYNP